MKKESDDPYSIGEAFTTTCHLRLGEDNIIRIRFFRGARLTKEDMINHYHTAGRLSNGKKTKVLIDLTERFTVTSGARKYAASKEATETRIATAFYSPSGRKILMWLIFLFINRPGTRVKYFFSEKKATEWLRNIKD